MRKVKEIPHNTAAHSKTGEQGIAAPFFNIRGSSGAVGGRANQA
jgi:hypothetical protein